MSATQTTNLGLNKPDRQDYVSVVSDINQNMDRIDSSVGNIITPVFSPSTAYSVGDYVIYNRELYRFTTAHPAGSWNSSHVAKTNLAQESNSLKSALNNHVYPITGQEDELVFESAGGINTDIYLEAGKTYTIENVTSSGGTMTGGTLYIAGHTDVTVTFPGVRGGTVDFTPQYSGLLKMYTGIAGKAGIRVVGKIDEAEQDIDDLDNELNDVENAVRYNVIQTTVGKYMQGTTIGDSVTLSGTNYNWVYTSDPLYVLANTTIKCKTRANGMCCIAISQDNDISNAKIVAVADNDSSAKEYSYFTAVPCYVFISGRVNETTGYAINGAMDGLEIVEDYLQFSEIQNIQIGKFIIGTTIDQTISLSGTNYNWVYTPVGTFVKAGKTVRCRTRANGMCCIAVSATNNIASAVVKAVANDDSKINEYTYIATSDCYVFISGRVNETTGYIDGNSEKPEIYVVATGSSFTAMLKALASNSNEKIIYVDEGIYDIYEELGGDDYIATISDPSNTSWRDVNAIVPPNTTIIGRGNVTLEFAPTAQQIGSQAMAFLFSPLNISGNCKIENITIFGKNCRYAIHDESSGLSAYADTEHIYKNVRVRKEHGTYGGVQAFGSGLGRRSRWEFESCEFTSDNTNIWTVHTTLSNEDDSASIIFNNCVFAKDNTENESEIVQFIVGDSSHAAKENFVKINNCYIGGSVALVAGYQVTQKFNITSLGSTVKGGFTISENFTTNPYPIKQY